MSRLSLHDDDGAAIVEFVSIVVVLVVPLTYLVLTVFDVQRAAFAATSAAREAARSFVLSPTSADAESRGRAAASIALRDQGVEPDTVSVRFTCTRSPCLTPSATVAATVATSVRLPLVPSFLRGVVPLAVPVQVTSTQVVDTYRAPR